MVNNIEPLQLSVSKSLVRSLHCMSVGESWVQVDYSGFPNLVLLLLLLFIWFSGDIIGCLVWLVSCEVCSPCHWAWVLIDGQFSWAFVGVLVVGELQRAQWIGDWWGTVYVMVGDVYGVPSFHHSFIALCCNTVVSSASIYLYRLLKTIHITSQMN